MAHFSFLSIIIIIIIIIIIFIFCPPPPLLDLYLNQTKDDSHNQTDPKHKPTTTGPTATSSSATTTASTTGPWITKSFCGVQTRVIGQSSILNAAHIDQLESALPETHQVNTT